MLLVGALAAGFTTVAFTPHAHSAEPTALWIGDSYTAGFQGEGTSYPRLVSDAMDWKMDRDAIGGTGFLANGVTSRHPSVVDNVPLEDMTQRLARDHSMYEDASVVIVDGGRNDFDTPATRAAVTTYLQDVRKDWPHATVVVVLPYELVRKGEGLGEDFAAFEGLQADSIGATVIDAVSEGWGQPTSTSGLISSDGVHPNAAGYTYIAKQLSADFENLGL